MESVHKMYTLHEGIHKNVATVATTSISNYQILETS